MGSNKYSAIRILTTFVIPLILVACAGVTPTPPLLPSPTKGEIAPTAILISPTATRPVATQIPSPTVALVNPLCPQSNTLEDLKTCIVRGIPRRDSQGYVVPPDAALDDARNVAAQMLTGRCEDIELGAVLRQIYFVGAFVDKDKNQRYCALMEIADENKNGFVDRGWGTFIVNNAPSRELSIQAPHALFDLDTETQAMGVFKATNSRTFFLAGAHRDANTKRTSCQPNTDEGEADPAHNANTLYHSFMQAVVDFYAKNGKDWVTIQFHGKAASSCPGVDAFMTYGNATPPAPGTKLQELKANMLKRHPTWAIKVPGDSPSCSLTGGTNVQGRLLNGVPAAQVCTVSASGYSGKFIHIEQNREMRNAADWIDAINETWTQ